MIGLLFSEVKNQPSLVIHLALAGKGVIMVNSSDRRKRCSWPVLAQSAVVLYV